MLGSFSQISLYVLAGYRTVIYLLFFVMIWTLIYLSLSGAQIFYSSFSFSTFLASPTPSMNANQGCPVRPARRLACVATSPVLVPGTGGHLRGVGGRCVERWAEGSGYIRLRWKTVYGALSCGIGGMIVELEDCVWSVKLKDRFTPSAQRPI